MAEPDYNDYDPGDWNIGALIRDLRAALSEHHDTVDGEHQTDVRPNWAMRATNLLDEIEAEVPQELRLAKAAVE